MINSTYCSSVVMYGSWAHTNALSRTIKVNCINLQAKLAFKVWLFIVWALPTEKKKGRGGWVGGGIQNWPVVVLLSIFVLMLLILYHVMGVWHHSQTLLKEIVFAYNISAQPWHQWIGCTYVQGNIFIQLVSWCFEPSQPQRIISGLNTNFNLSPSYSFHKSLHHKSFILKQHLRFYPQFRNVTPQKKKNKKKNKTKTTTNNNNQKYMFWSLFIFRGLSTLEALSGRVTFFILRGLHRNHVLNTTNTGKTRERFWKKMQVNGSEG